MRVVALAGGWGGVSDEGHEKMKGNGWKKAMQKKGERLRNEAARSKKLGKVKGTKHSLKGE